MNTKQEIPVFFSCDDNYVPYLTVAIRSLIEHSSKENDYRIIVLTSSMKESNKDEIKLMETKNIKISFEDISKSLEKVYNELKLRLRDYYSTAIYYRLFIPSLFPFYEKAIYLDADMVILDDVAKLYNMDIGQNLLIATQDMVVHDSEDFRRYSKIALGLEPKDYINSGMLVMNLREMRKQKIEQKFIYLLLKYNMEVVAPDQDYLNILCQGKIKYISEGWDKMPDFGNDVPEEDLHIVHYNMMRKPWHYEDVSYSNIFWKYAEKTSYYDSLREELNNYTDKHKEMDLAGMNNMVKMSYRIMDQDLKLVDVVHEANMITSNNLDDKEFTTENLINMEGALT